MIPAMDRAASARKYDLNGWFEIADNPISREGVFPYSGAQIGAPDPHRIYMVYRGAEELSDPEALASFRLVPIIDGHLMLGDRATPTDDVDVAGVIGENVRFERGVMLANLKIYSKALAEKIKSGKTELSCGYRCVYDFTPGFWNGQAYDVVQRKIRGNHLALVDEGRMGPDVRVLDHLVFTADAKEISTVDEEMKKALAEIMARLAKLEAGEIGEKPAGTDEDMPAKTEEKPPATDEDTPPPAKTEGTDEDPAAAAAMAKEGMDALTREIKALAARVDTLTARPVMDEAAVVATIASKEELARKLFPHIGVFDHSKMTTLDVVKYGVGKLGLKVAAGSEAIALDAALQVRQVPSVAVMDAARSSPLATAVAGYINK